MNLGRAIGATGKVRRGPITTQGKICGKDQVLRNPEIGRFSLVHLKHTQIKVKFFILSASCTIGPSALCSDRQTYIHILDIPPAISEKMQLFFFSKNLKFVRKSDIFQKSEFFPKSNFSPQNPIFLLPKIKIIHNSCKSHNMSERNHVPRQPC